MRYIKKSLAILFFLGLPTAAETVFIEAARDATLIEHPDGAMANGSGPFFFAGRTSQAQNGIRRGLLSALPRNAIVEGVSLRLYQSGSNTGTRELRLHRVQAPWGEGPSSSSGGGGVPAGAGDATWIHSFYDEDFWVRRGGQFLGRASARQEVGDTGYYTWDSSRHLVEDVRLWNSAPGRNFGWIVIGDEATEQNAKKLASRENPDAARRPRLEVIYRLAR
jgi:hypothetical protein